jgi:hypothetical protein
MQMTRRNLTSQRVADPEHRDAKAWLVRRLAWEQRLRELESQRGAETRADKAHAVRVVGERVPVAGAS